MSADFLVIIPTYRRASLLEAVESALNQSHVTVRIVVVDDCPDGSAQPQIGQLNDPRVTYLKNPKPTGGRPSVVRNLGFDYAAAHGIEGAIVHFLDDDDIVPAGRYALIRKAFAQHKNIGVIFGIVEPFAVLSDEEGTRALQEQHLTKERRFFTEAADTASACVRIGAAAKVPLITQWLFASQAMFGRTLFICSAAAIRRECVETLGGFDTSIRLMEDWEFYARAIQRFGAYFTGDISIKYRVANLEKSLMHAVVQPDEERIREGNEIDEAIRWKQDKLRKQLGNIPFNVGRILHKAVTKPLLKYAMKKR